MTIPSGKNIARAALLTTFFTAGALNAATLDFEDLTISDTHTLGNSAILSTPYHGLNFGYPWLGFDNANDGMSAHSGSWVAGNQYGGNATISVPSGTFVLNELWIRAFYNNPGTGVNIRGYNGASLEYTIPVVLPTGSSFTPATDPWLQIAGNSTAVTSVKFEVVGGTFFEIDDLTVTLSSSPSVPDSSSTFLLSAISALTMAAIVRRQG